MDYHASFVQQQPLPIRNTFLTYGNSSTIDKGVIGLSFSNQLPPIHLPRPQHEALPSCSQLASSAVASTTPQGFTVSREALEYAQSPSLTASSSGTSRATSIDTDSSTTANSRRTHPYSRGPHPGHRAEDKLHRARHDRSNLSGLAQTRHDMMIIGFDDYKPIKQQSRSNARTSGLMEDKTNVDQYTAIRLVYLEAESEKRARLEGAEALRAFQAQREAHFAQVTRLSSEGVVSPLGENSYLGSDLDRTCRPFDSRDYPGRVGCATHTSENAAGGDTSWVECRVAHLGANYKRNMEKAVQQAQETQRRSQRSYL